jgi:hypothetical protein
MLQAAVYLPYIVPDIDGHTEHLKELLKKHSKLPSMPIIKGNITLDLGTYAIIAVANNWKLTADLTIEDKIDLQNVMLNTMDGELILIRSAAKNTVIIPWSSKIANSYKRELEIPETDKGIEALLKPEVSTLTYSKGLYLFNNQCPYKAVWNSTLNYPRRIIKESFSLFGIKQTTSLLHLRDAEIDNIYINFRFIAKSYNSRITGAALTNCIEADCFAYDASNSLVKSIQFKKEGIRDEKDALTQMHIEARHLAETFGKHVYLFKK